MKDPLLMRYHDLVKQLWENFEKILLVQIPEEKNSKADVLSKIDLSNPKRTAGIFVEYMDQPSTMSKSEVLIIDPPNWKSPIIEYLKCPSAPIDFQSAKLRIRATRYTLIDNIMYKKINEGICGQHLGRHALAHKALK